MKEELHQGDILKIEHIGKPVLIVSKDFFSRNILAVYDLDYGLYAAFTMYIITHEFNNIGQDTPCPVHKYGISRFVSW